MERGLYTVGSAMWTQTRRMEVLSNNLSNLQTAGYKAESLLSRSFADVYLERIGDASNVFFRREVGPHNFGIHVDEVINDFTQGVMDRTDVNSHLAIDGDGFFAVQTPDGLRYTRNGAFVMTATGQLTTAEGYPVMGTGGAIVADPATFTVDLYGNVISMGNTVNAIALYDFADRRALRKLGSGLYDPGDAAPIATAGHVYQGMLEMSNTDSAKDMVAMIELYRNYEANQRAMRIIDESIGKAVNNIAAF